MKRFAVCTIGMLIAASALAAKPDVIWFDTPLGPVDVNETVKCLAL